MFMPNQVHEAARQILEIVSDLHGELALAGQQELVEDLGKIRRKAVCIMQMERPELDVRESARQDMMNAIGSLGHAINRNLEEWPNFNGEETVIIIRLAECCVKRGQVWMEMVVAAEDELRNAGYLKDFEEGSDDN
jgi:hypothetical protein